MLGGGGGEDEVLFMSWGGGEDEVLFMSWKHACPERPTSVYEFTVVLQQWI